MKRASSAFRVILVILLLTGTALRVHEYLKNRALWLDEANIAYKIRTLPVENIIRAKDPTTARIQALPMGFIYAQRAALQLCGDHELTWRLIPLLCGIAALFAFAGLASRILSPPAALFATALFAVSRDLIYYAAEAKPYAGDVLIAIILAHLYLSATSPHARTRHMWIFGITGALAVWCSFPAVFILIGAGGAWLIDLALRKQWHSLRTGLMAAALTTLSFCFYFEYSLKYYLQHAGIINYWEQYFMPRGQGVMPALIWSRNVLNQLFWDNLQYPSLLAILLTLAGMIFAFRAKRNFFYLTVIPIALTFFLAIGHKYPFGSRVLSFLFPFLIVLTVYGLEQLATRRPRPIKILFTGLCVTILSFYPILFTAQQAAARTGIEEIRPVLEYIRAHKQPDDAIVIYFATMPAFRYYYETYDLTHNLVSLKKQTLINALHDGNLPAPGLFERGWYIFTHVSYFQSQVSMREAMLTLLDQTGRRLDQFEILTENTSAARYTENGISASVYLYDFDSNEKGADAP